MAKLIGSSVHEIMHHPNKDALFEKQNKNPYKPFSEESETNESHYGKRSLLTIFRNLFHKFNVCNVRSIGSKELSNCGCVFVWFLQMQHEN